MKHYVCIWKTFQSDGYVRWALQLEALQCHVRYMILFTREKNGARCGEQIYISLWVREWGPLCKLVPISDYNYGSYSTYFSSTTIVKCNVNIFETNESGMKFPDVTNGVIVVEQVRVCT